MPPANASQPQHPMHQGQPNTTPRPSTHIPVGLRQPPQSNYSFFSIVTPRTDTLPVSDWVNNPSEPRSGRISQGFPASGGGMAQQRRAGETLREPNQTPGGWRDVVCSQDDLPDLGAVAVPGREGLGCARGTGGEKLEQGCAFVVEMRLRTFRNPKVDRGPLCVLSARTAAG